MSLRLAGCVILNGPQKFYLLHRNKNSLVQWELPGGKVENDEDIEETAIRELKEELGVTVQLVRKLGDTHFKENNTDHFYTWFLAEVTSGQMKICEPQTFDDLKSYSIDEMFNLELSNNMIKLHEAIVAGTLNLS